MKPESWKHQAKYAEEETYSEYHGLLWSMGAGKSRSIIDNACVLFNEGEIEMLIIVALNGVHTNWSRRQIPRWIDEDIKYDTIVWSSAKHKTKYFRTHVSDVLAMDDDVLKIICINTEAFSRRGGSAHVFMQNIIKRYGPRALIALDESSGIKNPKVIKSKVLVQLSAGCKYRRILTGTPMTESPFNIFSQSEFLKKGIMGTNYFMFTRRYGRFITKRFGPGRSFEDLVSFKNLDELRERIAEFCSEVKKSDCIDLPPKVYIEREVEMTDEQIKIYNMMIKTYTAEVDGTLITTDNPLTKLTKLHQITTGHIIDEEGHVKTFANNRIQVLQEILEETDCKVIIWSQYVQPIREIMACLGDVAVEYSGSRTTTERDLAVDQFQSDPSIRYIVISMQSNGAYGLDLFAAGMEVYYCNGYSLERRMQSEERAHRPGQEHDNVTIVDMFCPETVDEKVMQAHTDKIDIGTQVTSLMLDWLR